MSPAPSHPKSVPPAGVCFGRDEHIADLVWRFSAQEPKPTVLLGTAGIGKSTLTRAALSCDYPATPQRDLHQVQRLVG